MTSCRYYETESVDQKLKSFIETTTSVAKQKSSKTKQSRHLPYCLWYLIAKCNGIPLKNNEKPVLGTIIHILTFASAITYATSNIWFVVYDILSPNTPQDIPGGTICIFMVFCWCAFGYYCKDLCSRLFCHPRFLKDVRMHSRTVFKINAALLIFLLGSVFTAANVEEDLSFLNQNYCEKIDADPIVCTVLSISSITFSVFTLIWHSLVSFVFISVCRTHTIGLRRYIREIEHDAAICERRYSFLHRNFPISQDDIWQESIWMAEEDDEDELNGHYNMQRHRMSAAKRNINPKSGDPADANENLGTNTDNKQEEISILFSPVSENLGEPQGIARSEEFEWNYLHEDQYFIPVRRMKPDGADVDVPDDSSVTAHTMAPAEIMHHYWKLNYRLRFSSCALQRWFASFIALVLLRCSTYLVHWLGHSATVFDIIQFIIPLILLIVLSTALAEVNVEGQRALRCMYPTQERLQMFQFLAQNPLQMSIYGFGMTHGTIVTVVFAILVGFVTRIIITEMTK